jgi:L-iditol 2-dehydrogenase
LKAMVKTAAGFGNIELREWPDPQAAAGQVVVEILQGGICSTDVAIYQGTYKGRRELEYPCMIGHEAAGNVVETGPGVKEISVGTRVGLQVIWGRPYSRQSLLGYGNVDPDWNHLGASILGGTFAEAIAIRADRVFPLPDHVDWDRAAMLEPLAVASHAMKLVAVAPGETFGIVGPGPFGLLMCLIARESGASKIFALGIEDTDEARLRVARQIGAETLSVGIETRDAIAAVLDMTEGEGLDVVMDCGGTPTSLPLALDLAAAPGRVGVFGFAGEARIEPLRQIIRKSLTLYGVSAARRSHYGEALRMLSAGLDPTTIVTHRHPVSELVEAIELVRDRSAAKVLIDPFAHDT